MPDEGAPHSRTWMAFGPSPKIWGRKLHPHVQDNLALIAKTISNYEPVTMLVRPEERAIAAEKCGPKVNLLECPIDDLWIRDSGPVFVLAPDGSRAGVDFNFNGWGKKQAHKNDAKVAATVLSAAGVPRIETDLCMEGGGIEIDGEGTAIVTESCTLIQNRNPDWNKADFEAEIEHLLGVKKVIWIPGVKGADITDGHTDFYARFTSPGTVVAHLDHDRSSSEYKLTRKHLEILEASTDARGKKLRVVTLAAPTTIRDRFSNNDFCAGYINFYVCNGAVLGTEFGDAKADGESKEKLASLFPGRTIEMLNIDAIAAGGDGIHCATQQQPK